MTTKDPGESTLALVLRRQDYSEHSQIARLMTRNRGRATVVAKGIRKPNPALLGPMDLAQLGEATIRFRKGDTLHLLTRWRVVTGFPGLREDLARFHAASHVVEILYEGHRDLDPEPQAFDLAVESLVALELALPAAVSGLVLRFELRWLRITGFALELAFCTGCRRPAPDRAAVRISPGRGGIVCAACLNPSTPGLIPLSSAARRRLRRLEAASTAEALSLELSTDDAAALRRVMDPVVTHALERELPTMAFLTEPSPIA